MSDSGSEFEVVEPDDGSSYKLFRLFKAGFRCEGILLSDVDSDEETIDPRDPDEECEPVKERGDFDGVRFTKTNRNRLNKLLCQVINVPSI
jgi:hypothetical protein